MKNRTYEEHLKKWNRARNLVKKHNDKLISKWRSTPWWKFWDRPSFEEQKLIIISNWKDFEILPVGGHINRLYNCGPLWPIIIKDDQVYPDGLFDSYSQEIFTCPRCGKQLVHHL